MSSLKDQAARIAGRGGRLTATFDDIAARDRDLQDQFNSLTADLRNQNNELREQVAELQRQHAAIVEDQKATWAAMRTVVDDLGDRIGALAARLEQSNR